MNQLANSRGAFLDLVLVSNISNTEVMFPFIEEQIDGNSRHHSALLAIIAYESTSVTQHFKELDYYTTNLTQTALQLQEHVFDLPSDSDIQEALFDEPLLLRSKIHIVTDSLRRIQDTHTTTKRRIINRDSSKYAWTQSKRYQKLWSKRRAAKKLFLLEQSENNKLKLKEANIALATLYNSLKIEYYEKIINELQRIRTATNASLTISSKQRKLRGPNFPQ